jgi:hypothetical protein
MATENIAKKVIVKGIHDIIPNYVAGGMDATEGTYVWNHTMISCPEEEWEELYKGKLRILEDEVITLDRLAGQRAWLKLEKGVTVCGRRLRSTHLQHLQLHAPSEDPGHRCRRVLDARDARGAEAVTSSRNRRTKRRGSSLWYRSPGSEESST